MGQYEIELSAENKQRVIIHILPSPKVSRETSSTVAPASCNLLAACRTAATTPGSLTARASFTRPIFIPETPAFSWYDTIVNTEYMTSDYDDIGHYSWYIAMFFRYTWLATKTLNNAGGRAVLSTTWSHLFNTDHTHSRLRKWYVYHNCISNHCILPFLPEYIPVLAAVQISTKEECSARSRYQGQRQVITSHILWGVIICPCPWCLLLAQHSSTVLVSGIQSRLICETFRLHAH